MHLWDPKLQKFHRIISQNKAPLSENATKEDERVLFHPLSSSFMKENLLLGGSCVGFLGFFCPKGALGSQKHVEEVAEVSEEIWRFLKKFCEATLSNLLSATQVFQNPPLDGGPQHSIHVRLC